jgi:transcriptional regulator with XRE-family HTH domain
MSIPFSVATRSDIFDSRPQQILALRKAIGWSRQSLGRHLNLYLNPKDCYTIYRWEKGLARPRRWMRMKLCFLANCYREKYLHELGNLQKEAPQVDA